MFLAAIKQIRTNNSFHGKKIYEVMKSTHLYYQTTFHFAVHFSWNDAAIWKN